MAIKRKPTHILPPGYKKFLNDLKVQIKSAQAKAVLAVNREQILLYWRMGKNILQQQERHGWGAKVIDQLAKDLQREFPRMKGFSPRNLKYMRAFADAYPNEQFVQQLVAQIPWGHNVRILDHLKDPEQREWYVRQTIANGWTRAVLIHQIESDLYQRQAGEEKVTNFPKTLPQPQSELMQEVIKDQYVFDFLPLGKTVKERELEQGLLERIKEFLLELGAGFAFMGSQYHMSVGGQDFYVDLVFYHHRLRCLVAIDLKMEDFKPEFAGKMNFYLSAMDDLIKHSDDQPSVGIILCKGKNRIVAEYAVRDMSKPMGVAEYRLTAKPPKALTGALPSAKELKQLIEGSEENE